MTTMFRCRSKRMSKSTSLRVRMWSCGRFVEWFGADRVEPVQVGRVVWMPLFNFRVWVLCRRTHHRALPTLPLGPLLCLAAMIPLCLPTTTNPGSSICGTAVVVLLAVLWWSRSEVIFAVLHTGSTSVCGKRRPMCRRWCWHVVQSSPLGSTNARPDAHVMLRCLAKAWL